MTNPGIQGIYAQLASDEGRNRLILDDVVRALEEGRSPLLLTERRDHVAYFAERLRNLIVQQGGVRSKARRAVTSNSRASHGVEDDTYVIEHDEEVLRLLDNDFP